MPINYIRRFTNRHMPRWVVLNFDLLVAALSFSFSYLLIQNVRHHQFSVKGWLYPLVLVLSIRLVGIVITKSYKGIIKYTSSQDAVRIFKAMVMSTAGILFVQQFVLLAFGTKIITASVIVVDFALCLILLTSLRLGYKILYRSLAKNPLTVQKNVVIYGAGSTGIAAKRSIETDNSSNLRVIAFLDDDKQLAGKLAEGIPIYNFSQRFEDVLHKFNPSELIIAIPNLVGYKKKKVIELGLKHNLTIKNVPPVDTWINGEFSFKQIKGVNIEDLLGREPINLENNNIQRSILGKTVLITGAAGSIGSEIAKQCLWYKPAKLILLDQAETPLYELEYQLKSDRIEMVIADVSNQSRMENVFKTFKPEVVFHAAAYKHVPLMEDNPYEALKTNVFGTRITANLAVKYETEKFVFVSTDKAVNPTNIMGASKRIAEVYVQSFNNFLSLKDDHHTRFITTRFGNVLGSNGSVIPRFQNQIEKGGPITVTHPDITRYFMTIPEACQLVLEAGAMGNGGEIFIFDMGESVKIVDLAKKMIRLSGFDEGKEIDIVFTGLRPGEKLTEELLNQHESTIGTHHPKIMIARVREYNFHEVNDIIDSLCNREERLTNRLIVTTMKQLVPEYISNNSQYEALDNKAVVS
ncbi:MAG: SDR family NAD(P)-dependent oxidoreductase [Bacteroidetes bacterium]|nr:SDR family NAD(P)-dependent oxidoreductase [Bacteroidota bacterium]